MKMKFTIESTFYNMGHFRNALNQFAIVRNFELHQSKKSSQRVTTKCRYVDYTWRVHASVDNVAESFTIENFCKEHTFGTRSQQKATGKLVLITSILKDQIAHYPGTTTT